MEPDKSLMLTDLYQLTMLQSYLDQGMEETAVFEFFVRKLPPKRNFLIAAGLPQLLEFLEQARFDEKELEYLAGSGLFRANLIDYLADFRFSGSVHAMAEGTAFFTDEPVVRITAPLLEAQLIETRLINLLQLPILTATKAARCRLAAGSKLLVEFGLRRAHGAEAGLMAARASYLGGFNGSANVLAGFHFGLPIMGTMAHSFIEAHDEEAEAFRHFAYSQPDNVILLIDTYDIGRGAQRVAELAPQLAAQGIRVKGVRIDSGDLAKEAKRVRRLLDQAGQQQITIFVSGNLDEYQLKQLEQQQAPIDGYGVGTSLTTSDDAPSLNCVYKMQEYAGIPRRKKSSGKATWPGRKQVYRHYLDSGELMADRLCPEDEAMPEGTPLLQQIMKNGKRTIAPISLEESRERVKRELATLPERLRRLDEASEFAPEISPALEALAKETDRRFGC